MGQQILMPGSFPAGIGQEGVKVSRDKQVTGMDRKMRDKAALLIRKGKEP